MKCPKCHNNIDDNTTVCPNCKKVLALECPNCGNITENSACENCGYTILIKCSKCSKIVNTKKDKCKCGFETKTSIAYQECDTDEFASIKVKFGALKSIRKKLKSKELYNKFCVKLKNLIRAQVKNFDGKIIYYEDVTVINFNKELSLNTSANKACRFAIKLVNAFTELNLKILEELSTPLNLTVTVTKKLAENLQVLEREVNNIQTLDIKKKDKKYLKGSQLIIDEYIQDIIHKDFATNSIYSIEKDGKNITYYEILLDKYVLPPAEKESYENNIKNVTEIKKNKVTATDNKDSYRFSVFDINAKCNFEKVNAFSFTEKLKNAKIISIRGNDSEQVPTSEIIKYYKNQGFKVIQAYCTAEGQYNPWNVFVQLFKDYNNMPFHNALIPADFDLKRFGNIKRLILGKAAKAGTYEDARFAYMDDFCRFLSSLKNTVIFIDRFEYLDDTSIQTLTLFFDKFKNINSTFIFTTNEANALHFKIKGLLRTPLYTELSLCRASISSAVSGIKEDAGSFINSFYYEKIEENFGGSKLYFDNAINYLQETGVLVNFDNKYVLRENKSVVIPQKLSDLIIARFKLISKDIDLSMILAYSSYLGARLDFKTLEMLGINNIEQNAKILAEKNFATVIDNVIYINNFNFVKPIMQSAIKKDINEFLSKNILAKLGKGLDDTSTLLTLGKLSLFKEEYLLLWKNAKFCIEVGDYDAYLKNSLGFLSLIKELGDNIPQEEIEENKKEVYENLLINLYNYSSSKIYPIEQILLTDAIKNNDKDKIVKLSNMMLQGALISSNYTDALSLLRNIFAGMKNPTLVVNGKVNTKFLLLSLVNIEILFNIGDLHSCIETAEELLHVINPEIIEKITPAGFSAASFIEHILETLRLAALSKIFIEPEKLENYLSKIKKKLDTELPDTDALLSIKDFLAGKEFSPSQTEDATPYSKIIYLILQEFSNLNGDFKTFAQNIYQAKLLSTDIHQTQLEFFCDILIGYAYAKAGYKGKAESIYNDIIERSEKSAIFNTLIIAKYTKALLKISNNEPEEGLLLINDALATLQKLNNVVLYTLFETLYIRTAKILELGNINIENEIQQLKIHTQNCQLNRITKDVETLLAAENTEPEITQAENA